MARIQYGPAVRGGVLRYTSPSAMDLADARLYGGCLRKWWYKYVDGKKEPESEAQQLGTRCHDEVATYLTTGQDTLGTIARTGVQHIPAPGPDLRVEWSVCPTPDLALSDLAIAGVPVIGYGDLAHGRGENKVAYGEILLDPPGTLEVIDWKFVGSIADRAKTAEEVGRATPMLAYGEALSRHVERAGHRVAHIRLSHVYFQTRGRTPSAKRSRLLAREEVARGVEQMAPLVRSIVDAARATSANDVPGNPEACDAFRRDCPHRAYCSVGRKKSLAQVVGSVSAADILRRVARAGSVEPEPKAQQGPPMSLLNGLLAPAGAPAPDLSAQIAALRAEEVAAAKPPPYTPEFAAAWTAIELRAKVALPDGGELGYPTTTGAAARALTALKGWGGDASTHNGVGRLQKMTTSDPQQVIDLAKEIVESFPPLAADPAVPTGAAERSAAAPPPALMPPDSPAPVASVVAPTPAAPAPAETAPAEGKAKAPKRKKAAPAPADGAPVAAEVDAGDFELFVDAVPRAPYQDLRPVISQWGKLVCDKFAPGIADVRCAPNTSEIGYGKWRAVLGALAVEVVEKAMIAGRFYLDTRGSELAEVVADALHDYVAARGVR